MPSTLKRLTPAQRRAYAEYCECERQEDRYMGSVFVNAHGQRNHEANTRAAYLRCKALGMTTEHGL